jgi:uncharacterized membrane protein YhaH (DUF805 family)
MSFSTAIQTCLSKYATFEGRAGRPEYWYFYLFFVVAYIPLIVIAVALPKIGWILLAVFVLGMIVPSLAATVRRLHDTNHSGWWYWISLIPLVGGIVLLVFLATAGTPGANDFGPVPA